VVEDERGIGEVNVSWTREGEGENGWEWMGGGVREMENGIDRFIYYSDMWYN